MKVLRKNPIQILDLSLATDHRKDICHDNARTFAFLIGWVTIEL